MARRHLATADGPIPYGADILVRGNDAIVASQDIANAKALKPAWFPSRSGKYRKGDTVEYEPVAGIGQRDLHAIANGPIMDPKAIYLPAGKITEAEYRERQRQILNPEGEP